MIISIFNQKGGVAKTTTTINLGSALALKGNKVCLVDMDAQANTTNGVGISDEDLTLSIYDLLVEKKVTKKTVLSAIQPTQYKNLDLLPSDISLSNAEITLSNVMSRETVLSRIIETIKDQYDYILIDCPPSLGLLSINSLVASDQLIIPVSTSFFSIKGIKHLLDTVTLVQENLKPDLDILGVLITMYDKRKNISKEIKDELSQAFGDKIFDTIIRINSQIEYAQDHQVPIVFYDKSCNGYIDYMKLANEVIGHEGK